MIEISGKHSLATALSPSDRDSICSYVRDVLIPNQLPHRLDELIAARESELFTPQRDSDTYHVALMSFCYLLWTRAYFHSKPEDLDKAVQVVNRLGGNTQDARLLSLLSQCLVARHQLATMTNNPEDLKTAKTLLRTALEISEPEHHGQIRLLLGLVIGVHYTSSRNIADLNQAITEIERAAETETKGSLAWSHNRGIYGRYLLIRYRQTGEMDDIDKAISEIQQAIALSSAFHSNRRTWSSNLVTAFRLREQGHYQHSLVIQETSAIAPAVESLVKKLGTTSLMPMKPPAHASFESAFSARDRSECISFLTETPSAVTQSGQRFAWMREPLDMGFTPTEVVNLALDRIEEGPWICYDLEPLRTSRPSTEFHRSGCSHRSLLLEEFCSNLSAKEMTADSKRMISKMCGLAGIIPFPVPQTTWSGQVQFDESTAKVIYFHEREGKSDDPFLDAGRALHQCGHALDRVINLCSWLQKAGLICDHIIYLRSSRTEPAVIQSIAIRISDMFTLENCIGKAIGSKDQADYLRLCHTALRLLPFTSELQSLGDTDVSNLEMSVDACALAVQTICVAMLTFSQAHMGEVQPTFLEHPLTRIDLRGSDGPFSKHMSLCVSLVTLTCIGEMLGLPVMAFTSKAEADAGISSFDLCATPEVVIDLWGPGRPIQDPMDRFTANLRAIEIGGGMIYKPAADSPMLHWRNGHLGDGATSFRFNAYATITIGGVFPINRLCPASTGQEVLVSRKSIRKEVHELGTWAEQWTLQQMQAGFQGGQFMNATFNATWIKVESRTRKKKGLAEIGLDFLEQPWGLLVSLCTGVARRVALRETVAEVLSPMMADWMEKPLEWPSLASKDEGILKEMKKPTFRAWVSSLTSEQQRAVGKCVRHVLRKLCWTGVNHKAKLVLSCPSPEHADGCIHTSLKESHALASILRDSEQSATFACLTTTCVEVGQYQCQTSSEPRWRDRTPALITSVCQYQYLGADDWQKLPQKDLKDGKLYWMGSLHNKRRLLAEVSGRQGGCTTLKLSDSQTPWPFFIRAYERVERMRSYYVALREKSLMAEEHAEDVLVFNE